MATDYVSDYEHITGEKIPVEAKVVTAPEKSKPKTIQAETK